MNRRRLLSGAIRLLLAWSCLTPCVAVFGASMIMLAQPLVEPVVQALLPGYTARMSLPAGSGAPGGVAMALLAVRPVPLAGGYLVATGARFDEIIPAAQDLLPAVVAMSVLLAWPFRRFGERLRALAWGALACAVMLVASVSAHFVVQFEVVLQGLATTLHQVRDPAPVVAPYIFWVLGGQWLLALLIAVPLARGVTRKGAVRRCRSARQPQPRCPGAAP